MALLAVRYFYYHRWLATNFRVLTAMTTAVFFERAANIVLNKSVGLSVDRVTENVVLELFDLCGQIVSFKRSSLFAVC